MKHLLIILSILLLSSPVIGKETGVLYQYETSSGFVWKTIGNEKVQPKYEGEITNGKPNGFGFMTYPYDDKNIVGEWKNGEEFNTKHTKKDGTLIGKWVNGEWIGSWGVLYLGFRNGELRYFTEKWEGLETEYNRDLVKYEGEIKNGFPNGQVTETIHDGSKYVGEHKEGVRNGQGTLTTPDGGKYVGEWKNGEKNGQGTLTYPDGGKYVGEWKNGKKNGQGTFTDPYGNKYEGEYENGKYWNGLFFNKNGHITGNIVNGNFNQ